MDRVSGDELISALRRSTRGVRAEGKASEPARRGGRDGHNPPQFLKVVRLLLHVQSHRRSSLGASPGETESQSAGDIIKVK
jgi:hypothetical protein